MYLNSWLHLKETEEQREVPCAQGSFPPPPMPISLYILRLLKKREQVGKTQTRTSESS